MKKKLVKIFLLVALLSISGKVFADTLQDSYETPTGALSADVCLAQSFTPATNYTASKLSLNFTDVDGGTYDVYLDSDLIGHPSNIHLGSATAQTSSGTGWNTFTLGSPVSVNSGTIYWIVFKPQTSSGTSWATNSMGSYLGGHQERSTDCLTWDSGYDGGAYDMLFRTYSSTVGGGGGSSGFIGDFITNEEIVFASSTGLNFALVVHDVGDNFIKLFAGTGLAMLYELRYWIVSLIAIGLLVYFSYRALPKK